MTQDTSVTINADNTVTEEEIEEVVQELALPDRTSKPIRRQMAMLELEKRQAQAQLDALKKGNVGLMAQEADVPGPGETVVHSVRQIGNSIVATVRGNYGRSYIDTPGGAYFDAQIGNWRFMPRELAGNGNNRGWSFYASPINGEAYGGVMKGQGRRAHPLSHLDCLIGEAVEKWLEDGSPEGWSIKFSADHEPAVNNVTQVQTTNNQKSAEEIVAAMKNPQQNQQGNSGQTQTRAQRAAAARRNEMTGQ